MTETNGSGIDRPPQVVSHDVVQASEPKIVIMHTSGDENADRLEGPAPDEASGLRGQLIVELVGVLAETPPLASVVERELLRTYLEGQLPSLGLTDHLRARSFYAELVMRCTGRTGGLADLGMGIEMIAGGDPGVRQAQRLLEQVHALSIEPSLHRAWKPLQAGLRGLPLKQTQPVILEVTGGRLGVLPVHCDGTWPAFVHLVGQNGAPAGPLPPWVSFLEIVRDRFDEQLNVLTRHWTRELARSWGCTDDLERLQSKRRGQTLPTAKTAVLTMVVSPDPQDADLFTLHSFQRWDDDGSAPVSGEDATVRRDELTGEVERVVLQAEETWALRSADLKIEFVLPLTLINEPVEWWPKDTANPPPTTLGLYHSVVVRSFERLRRPAWHRVWLRKWERLQDRQGEVFWVRDPGRDDHVRRLEAELSDDDYVALVLSRPPSADSSDQEIMAALRAGIPLILWHRNGENTVAVREVMSQVLATPSQASEVASRVRRQLEQLAPREREAHPARALSILWDNAHPASHEARGTGST